MTMRMHRRDTLLVRLFDLLEPRFTDGHLAEPVSLDALAEKLGIERQGVLVALLQLEQRPNARLAGLRFGSAPDAPPGDLSLIAARLPRRRSADTDHSPAGASGTDPED